MPVTYSVDSEAGVIRTVCESPLRFEDVLNHFQALRADPACTGGLDVLLDVSNADTLPAVSQLSSITSVIGNLTKKIRFGACAIVATRDAMFGMMRIFEAFAGDHFRAIRVFRDAREAELWLISERNRSAPSGPPPRGT
ncbi:MAG TPA: hypothetical protein VKV39_15275 [Candidatus Sulfotelmatobacter sp.]|nr:hypothetical protein [Candidatus Sulfotelmatobacter sp.]